MNAIGAPLNALGVSARSSRSLIPDMITSTNVNPAPAPSAAAIASGKLYFESILMNVIPSTAQFVVMSGR